MAYPVPSSVTRSNTNGTITASFTATLPASGYAADDALFVCLTNDGGATTISTASTGWNMIGTQGASGGSRQAWAYKIATSSSETNPVFSGANDDWTATAFIVKDIDTTTPIHASSRTDWNNVNNFTVGGVTTTIDDCLLLYSAGADGAGGPTYMRAFLPSSSDGMVALDWSYDSSNGNCTQIVGYRQQFGQGAVPAINAWTKNATEGGNGWVIAIKNKTSGSRAPFCNAGATESYWYGELGTQRTPVTWQALNNFAGNPTIAGLALSTALSATTRTSGWGSWAAFSMSDNSAGIWAGATHTISPSINMQGKVFSLQWHIDASAASSYGEKGVCVGFADASNNYVIYKLYDYILPKGYVGSNELTSHIAIGNATELASSGSIDWTAVTQFAVLHHRAGSTTTARTLSIQNFILHDVVKLVGGGSNSPCSPVALDYMLNPYEMKTFTCNQAALQGATQMMVKFAVQIGDGTNATYYDGKKTALCFPPAYENSLLSKNRFWNCGAGSASVTIKSATNDTINLSASQAESGLVHNFTVDSASATTVTSSGTGASVSGFTPTWKTGFPCTGYTFSSCGTINFKGADVASCAITGTTANSSGASCAFDASGATVTNTTIDVSGTSAGYHLELGTSVTAITLTDVTFTGTPGTDKVHVLKTTGTVTIAISGTTTLAAGDVTSAGATVVISAPVLYQTVTISNATAGSRIQIYDTTSSTELYNGTPTFPYTWTDSVAASATRAIRLRCTYVSGTSAKQFIEANIGTCGITSGTEAVSYLVNQVNDTTYNTNAIDGPAIYATSGITFTDAATDLVNCNIAGGAVTYPTIYACFVHWCNTATGIANDFTYIDAPDTANYLFSSMKIKNTSATRLKITGGYGRDATSGLVADIIDDVGSTGNIYPSPDHVVPYATGSGLTAGQDSKLTAIDSVCSLFNFNGTSVYADVKKMNGSTVNGTGVAGDLWRG